MLEKLLDQKALITSLLVAVLIGGVFSYLNIGKLEDAEIPIKSAIVITAYPGATQHEVELEVTDVLERGIMKLEHIDKVTSTSSAGLSVIQIDIQQNVDTDDLPQLWDHLRRKVKDVEMMLPQGAYTPIVNDDFADTYGMLYAITSEGYTLPKLQKYTELIEREILKVEGVRRSQIFGTQTESIEILFNQEKLAGMKINPMFIAMAMKNQSEIANAGNLDVDALSMRINVESKFNDIADVENLIIQIPQGGSFRLGDIATVKRGFFAPKREGVYFNGKQALALGFSNESGINVVELGDRLDQRMQELQEELPAGIQIKEIYSQPQRVEVAVNDFVFNLVISIAIVIVILLLAMGYRSGLLISSGLLFTILGTLIVMLTINLPLHRVTLAAIILAMGMLVDNSIVVADGILVDLKKGINPKLAFVSTAKKTAMPLLGATLIAILAFFPLAMAPHSAGEFLSSLFTVLVISLLLSWVFAMIQTPFMAKFFYRKEGNKRQEGQPTPYDNRIYKTFRGSLLYALKHNSAFLIGISIILIGSLYGMKYMRIDFMPKIPYDQFVVEYELPEGSNLNAVEKEMLEIEGDLKLIDDIKNITLSLGRPPARFTLMRPMSNGGSNYGEFIIETKTVESVHEVIPQVQQYLDDHYPHAHYRLLEYGASFEGSELSVEFRGPDPAVLRELGNQAKVILLNSEKSKNVTDNWGNKSKKITPEYSLEHAQRLGITRLDMGRSLQIQTEGIPIGALYEGKNQVPIVLKSKSTLDENIENIGSVPVWGERSQFSVPLAQVTDSIKVDLEDYAIKRKDGTRCLSVESDVKEGFTGVELMSDIKEDIEAIHLPHGYSITYGGMVGVQDDANKALFKYFPLAIGLIVIITIALFNNLKQSLIVFMMIPFAFVGVSIGFNITGMFFDFMAIIGALGLIGMIIKNAIVLLDEINIGLEEGKSRLDATVDAAMSRMRPVMMASMTTILGMIPLLSDPMFGALALTIMSGLLVGTLITLMVIPVLYAFMYRIEVK
ncbi:efflux RND transporter permease subunit [Flammeovirga yaeyamensis]|uniref:Efflux RND transporter permease subunit n=1 Tax=Flammeovirga yaeyamensis TaxID=367791 RepID=A0AAX1N6H5_9BACT|nr:efflux RND transporter permease subunit [Flammeovirga yaeyamensis]MBB3697444.1 multidrug efflux pump subunit AcrB [Flammeovirga yaeyamensis]NMF36138.1 efflux RND transporter permease subunit [Flammeovirga yaeyamensis]QWG02871.1 efflux RND transporter permease subunit [Flammeovirga yaeyamensis]